MKKVIAIITARGGSKRIPKKNIRPFMGKPMLAYAIEACLNSGIFSEVMVSTDSEEIAKCATQYGAVVPFMRSPKTADDFATTADVLSEVFLNYEAQGKKFESACCVYPCVPFLTGTTLEQAFQKFQEEHWDSVIPVIRYPVPIEWAMKISDGMLLPENREAQNMRSQDITPKYYDAGMFYWFDVALFQKHHTAVLPRTGAFLLPESEAQDIDTLKDWIMAEMKWRILRQSSFSR